MMMHAQTTIRHPETPLSPVHAPSASPGRPDAPEPRESMLALPKAAQLPLTLLTGKPYEGQRPLHLTATAHLVGALVSITAGVVLGTVGWRLGGWALPLLPAGWAMTLHGMRNIRMMVYHQCAHRNMYRRAHVDTALGRLVAALLLVQNFRGYSREHVADHHALHHMTVRDPTVQAFLTGLRLRPGMSRRAMWRRLLGHLVSPRFHLMFAAARVRSFVSGSAPVEKAAALLIYGTAAAVVTVLGAWPAFAVVWLIPLFPLFQVANTLRLCVKHTFPAPDVTERRGKAYFAGLTNAIFIGEAAPVGGGVRPWARWALRMAFVHAPARYLVLTGDTVCHDFHHRRPATRRWADYIFERQRDAADPGHGWPPYREVWGLVPAIDAVFDSLRVADPDEYDARHITGVRRHTVFAAFDD